MIVEFLKRRHGAQSTIPRRPAAHEALAVNVPIELLKKRTGAPPAEELAERARDIPCDGVGVIIVDALAFSVLCL
jgi:hypothetical protein